MIPGFSVLYWISDRRKFASRFVHFAHETGIFCLGFRGPDCHVIAKQGGGPDARPSRAGSGPRAGGCPPLR